MEMNIRDINFAIEMLSHPQSGDESDIKEAFRIAIDSLKAWKEILEEESTRYSMSFNVVPEDCCFTSYKVESEG